MQDPVVKIGRDHESHVLTEFYYTHKKGVLEET